jgi:hypothetical protein
MFNLSGAPSAFLKTSLFTPLLFSKHLPKRGIKLHEYQAGKLLHSYKIPIPIGNVAFSGKEAFQVATQFGGKDSKEFVVKA